MWATEMAPLTWLRKSIGCIKLATQLIGFDSLPNKPKFVPRIVFDFTLAFHKKENIL